MTVVRTAWVRFIKTPHMYTYRLNIVIICMSYSKLLYVLKYGTLEVQGPSNWKSFRPLDFVLQCDRHSNSLTKLGLLIPIGP